MHSIAKYLIKLYIFIDDSGWDLSSVDDIECLGITDGILGTISSPGVLEPPVLMIIKESTPVGPIYPPNIVYKIKSICMLSNEEPDRILTPCPKHRYPSQTVFLLPRIAL